MKHNYIISNEELAEKGLDLNEYCVDGAYVNALINIGLDFSITRCCELNDNFKGEPSVEEALDNEQGILPAFKKLQFYMIYKLVFTAESDPVDHYIDSIICHELGWGKINGIQKGLYYKHN